ncbi:MAG: NUDIX domain-containing protein [Acidobacteria bacterium]|nr:NUDIX domain-containing protein [Acidobacteriota bacterium]
MTKLSAGILLYRFRDGEPEVLIVHPGGPFWKNKDLGAWSIPKGEYRMGQDRLKAAKREFKEELGKGVNGDFIALEPVRQSAGKIVHAFALEHDLDATKIKSNTFPMEWPPGSGVYEDIPEVDRAEWVSLTTARRKLIQAQAAFIDQLEEILRKRS